MYLFFYCVLHYTLLLLLILEREERRWRGRETLIREKYASCTRPTGYGNHNPSTCSDRELSWRALHAQGDAQPTDQGTLTRAGIYFSMKSKDTPFPETQMNNSPHLLFADWQATSSCAKLLSGFCSALGVSAVFIDNGFLQLNKS